MPSRQPETRDDTRRRLLLNYVAIAATSHYYFADIAKKSSLTPYHGRCARARRRGAAADYRLISFDKRVILITLTPHTNVS